MKKKIRPKEAFSALLSHFFVGLIKIYRITLGPLLGRQCRFVPTCSSYAIEAIERFGPIKGALLAVWRIARCNPFSKGRYDPPQW